MRPDLAERVHKAVELLGYRRDLTASTLRRADRQSASIGLIIEDVSNPFFSAVHRGVEDVARPRGVLTFVGSSDEDPTRERELAEAFAARGVDGLVIVPCARDQSYLLRDHQAGTALVFVDRPPRFMPGDAVVSDNVGGAREAVEHLIAAGHRRIAFLGDRLSVVHRGRAPGAAITRRSTPAHRARRSSSGRSSPTATPAEQATRELLRGRGPADRAVHRPEPDHDRRDPRAARARPPARRRAGRLRRRRRSGTSSSPA